MRSMALKALWVAVMAAPAALHAQQGQPGNPDRAIVAGVIAELASYIERGDFDAAGALFGVRGVHILTDNATAHGWAEYRDQHLLPKLQAFTQLRYAHTRVEVVVRDGVAWAAFRREMSSAAGNVPAAKGRGTAVLERTDGHWRIVHLHVSGGPGGVGPIEVSSDTSRVRATVEALFAAAERADMAALDTLYAGEDLTVIEGAGINRTWAQYRDQHLGPELREFRNFRYRPSQIEAHVHGDQAWAIFRYSLRADYQGRELDQVGRGTAILERRNDRWVVRHTQTSSRPRRPTDPPDW